MVRWIHLVQKVLLWEHRPWRFHWQYHHCQWLLHFRKRNDWIHLRQLYTPLPPKIYKNAIIWRKIQNLLKKWWQRFSWIPQCGNISIFLPLRFCVKSIFEIQKVQKCHFCHFGDFQLWFMINFSLQKRHRYLQIHKKTEFRASKCAKMADFAVLAYPKLISRKIWVIGKFSHCEICGKNFVKVTFLLKSSFDEIFFVETI